MWPSWLPIVMSTSNTTVNQPAIAVPRGKPPCQPQATEGSSSGSTVAGGRPFRLARSCPVPATTPPACSLCSLAVAILAYQRRHTSGGAASSGQCHLMTTHGVLLLGSTGSIGTQALDVVRANPDRFRVTGLAAGGKAGVALLAAQVAEFAVPRVAVADAEAAEQLRDALGRGPTEVLGGPDAVTELIQSTPSDVVLNGITGSRGLRPTLAALATGATLALANKESLVAGGPLVTKAAAPGQLVPVDSEHSALAQCLRGGRAEEVARLVLTASGGPFRGRRREDLAHVGLDDALKHPTWDMGPVVTINSATLVNKGLELIEAHLLFGVPYDRIDVVVHPQSLVHSMVEFTDGSTIAQAS